ncbi:MAG: hypothetical protein IBJ08_17710, partial [Pseudomonas sp.]|nr:hypothetical protein [Pseudomonas sp.]
VYTEDDWSDEKRQREKESWYGLGKTIAERKAWKFVEKNDKKQDTHKFSFATIQPTMVIGPLRQPYLNESNEVLVNYLTGKKKKIANSSYVLHYQLRRPWQSKDTSIDC